MQCKIHTFRVLSQDFGGKSKKIVGNLVTWLPAFCMYANVYQRKWCICIWICICICICLCLCMRWSLVIGQFTWENSDGLHISRGSFATWAFKHFNILFFVLVCHCYCLLISSPAQLNLRPVKKRPSIFSNARFLLTSHKCYQCYHLCICIYILTVKVFVLDNIKKSSLPAPPSACFSSQSLDLNAILWEARDKEDPPHFQL